MRKIIRRLLQTIKRLAELDSSPRKIAGSVAVGAFMGFIPTSGCQNWLALLLSIIFRVNKVGTVLSLQMVCNPLTLPLICYIDYKIGRWLLRYEGPGITRDFFSDLSWQKILDIAKPLFLGGLVLACIIAPIAYTVTLIIISRRRRGKDTGSR
jgi:uncharacterized protein (TIGR03546 family)